MRSWCSPVAALAASLLGACSPTGDEGEPCDDDPDCFGALVCRDHRCLASPQLIRDMARQSGVKIGSERPAATGGTPGAVRIRSAAARGFAFAVCAPNERLIGGWCDPAGAGGDSASFTVQDVVGNTADDTIGARWKCKHAGLALRAVALCQLVEASPLPPLPPSP